MQKYDIQILKKANKFIQSQNPRDRKRIYEEIYNLPNASDVVKMKRYDNRYRLRVGNYRIIFEKYNDHLIIIVIEADNRGDIY